MYVRLFFISTNPLHCMMLSMYDPEIWGRQRKTTCSTSDCGFLPVNFPKKITSTLGRLTFPSFSRVSFLPVLRTTPFWFASLPERCQRRVFFRGLLTVFHAQSLQRKTWGWSACRIASRLAGKLTSWSTKGWKLSFQWIVPLISRRWYTGMQIVYIFIYTYCMLPIFLEGWKLI